MKNQSSYKECTNTNRMSIVHQDEECSTKEPRGGGREIMHHTPSNQTQESLGKEERQRQNPQLVDDHSTIVLSRPESVTISMNS